MSDEATKAASGLAKMSLEDFLQEDISTPSKGSSPAIFQRPTGLTWENGRWTGCPREHSRHYISRAKHSRGRCQRSPMHPRKGGIQAGVMLTPDPPPLHPLSQKTSSHRPMESILTIGSHEAPLVKENAMKGRKLGESDLEVDLEKVLTNAQPDQEVNFVYNRKVALEAGQRCHFLPVDDVSHVRRNTILKLVVGLLNTGQKGVIYLGITEEGHVEGITAEPQEMGQFVEGIMKTVQFYLMPRLHAPQYGVRYTNVVTTSGQLLNNVWVVELHAVPEKQHYYNPIMDMNYHIRHGKDTKTLPFVDFCNVVVAETSRALEPEIQRLEGKIQQLRHALEAKGVDTSTVGFHVCKECYFNDCPVQCYGRDLTKEYSTN